MVSSICDLSCKSRNLSTKLIGWIACTHPSTGAVIGQRIYLPSHISCQKAHQQVALCQSHRPYVTHLKICLTSHHPVPVCVCVCMLVCLHGFLYDVCISTFLDVFSVGVVSAAHLREKTSIAVLLVHFCVNISKILLI